jgi:hypothetical protein
MVQTNKKFTQLLHFPISTSGIIRGKQMEEHEFKHAT